MGEGTEQDSGTIVMTQARLARFRLAYRKAKNAQRDTFVFDGHVVHTGYAKYMIDYARSQLYGGKHGKGASNDITS